MSGLVNFGIFTRKSNHSSARMAVQLPALLRSRPFCTISLTRHVHTYLLGLSEDDGPGEEGDDAAAGHERRRPVLLAAVRLDHGAVVVVVVAEREKRGQQQLTISLHMGIDKKIRFLGRQDEPTCTSGVLLLHTRLYCLCYITCCSVAFSSQMISFSAASLSEAMCGRVVVYCLVAELDGSMVARARERDRRGKRESSPPVPGRHLSAAMTR